MSDLRKRLMDAIEAKAKRKKDLSAEIALRPENVEAYVLKMVNDLEEMAINTVNNSLLAPLAGIYAKSFESQIRVLDPGANVEVKWIDSDGTSRVNGILIKWSRDYQDKNNCDEQLFVDVMGSLLK